VSYGADDGNRIVSPIHKSCDLTVLPPPSSFKWSQISDFPLGAHSFACEEVLAERVAFEPSPEVFRQHDTDHRTVNRGPR